MAHQRHFAAALAPVVAPHLPQIAATQAPARSVLAARTMDSVQPANDRAQGACVLVVDDEPTIRRLMRRALSGMGLDVVEAANGLEALERFRARHVVAVVSDVRMPVMNGLELVEHLRSEAPDLPIVLVSGSDEVRTRAGAQALGAADFLAKPFDVFELGCRVLSAVAANPRRAQRRQVA